jgi:hypothetical protein
MHSTYVLLLLTAFFLQPGYFSYCNDLEPIPVVVRSKVCAFSLLIAGIVGSNPAEGMDVRLLSVTS